MTDQLAFDFDDDDVEADDPATERAVASAASPREAVPALTGMRPGRAAATLSEVIDAVTAHPNLEPTRRRDCISAVRTIARLLHLAPAQLPTAPRELRRLLHDLHPAAAGMSGKRFRNVLADLVRALRIADVRVSGRCAPVPFTPEWQALHDACPTRWCKYRLAPFLRWTSEQGVAPEAVDTAILDAFMADREETSLELSAAALRRSIASNWNTCVEEAAGWPRTRLEMVPARVRWTLEWHRFTPAFRDDVDGCLERLAGADPLDEDGPDKPLRPATLKWRRFQIRMAASSLVAAGVPVEEIDSLRDVVTPERFRLLIGNLLARYGKKTGNIYGLATALKSIARHHCKLADDELEALRKICRRVLFKQPGMSRKNRDRLRPFTDPDARDRLLLEPQRLMQEASPATKKRDRPAAAAAQAEAPEIARASSRAEQPDRQAAMAAQMAAALEIALMAPLRAANLAALEIGRHLVFVGKGRQEYAVITLPEEEVKNELALEYPLPPESTRLVERYIAHFLPRLGPPGGTHLFPSPGGGAKRPHTLSNQIAAVVREATGHRVHLHLLRHFAAMIYLQAHPGAYEVVRRLLGQATATAALNAYVGLETAAAARQFDEVVLRLRRLASLRAGQGGRRPRR